MVSQTEGPGGVLVWELAVRPEIQACLANIAKTVSGVKAIVWWEAWLDGWTDPIFDQSVHGIRHLL
jgi:hypothetical protein